MNEHDESVRELPTWQLAIFSVVIGGHLLAVLAMILAVPSGPWPTADGNSLSTPPQFAYSLNNLIPRSYLQSLGMAHHDHHVSDDPARRGVFLELRLEDAEGRPLTTLTLPNPESNWWIRHRQSLLVRALADDIPIAPPEGEMISAPGQSASTTPIWEVSSNGGLELRDESLARQKSLCCWRGRWPDISAALRELPRSKSFVTHKKRSHRQSCSFLIRQLTSQPVS